MRLLLTSEFLSCKFNMFFPVLRGEIIARFRISSFLSRLDFIVVTWFVNTGGSYYIKNFCGSFGNYYQTYFMACDWFVTTRYCTQRLRQCLWHQPCGLTDPHGIVWFHKLLPFIFWCFVNWRHILEATAINVCLHMYVHPSYRKRTTLFEAWGKIYWFTSNIRKKKMNGGIILF